MAKIVVVEDNEMNMCLFKDLLTAKGETVFPCMDPFLAIDLIRKVMPDLIIMDIQLPGLSGIDLTKTIRKSPDLAHLKVLAISAFIMPNERNKIDQAGCDGYLSKPIFIPSFYQTVDKFLTC